MLFPSFLSSTKKSVTAFAVRTSSPLVGSVENDKFGVVHEGDGDGRLLFHTRGEIGNFRFGKLVYPEARKQHFFAFVSYLGGYILQLAEEIEDIAGGEKVVGLQLAGEKSYLRTYLVGLLYDAESVNECIALVGLNQGGQHAQRSGFARAVGA